jgi:hypothetical protein
MESSYPHLLTSSIFAGVSDFFLAKTRARLMVDDACASYSEDMSNLPGNPSSESAANNSSNFGGSQSSQHPSDIAIRQIVRRAINASPLLEEIVNDWQSWAHGGINE